MLAFVLAAGLLIAACGDESNDAASETECADGRDNDFDDRADCMDPDCARAPVCTVEHCYNLVDDDEDGDVDCADDECEGIAICEELGEHCVSGVDDDSDGETDCNDSDCALTATCLSGAENCTNGQDDDGDGDVDCEDTDCAKTAVCLPGAENCGNGSDDDEDGDTDCDDTDCARTAVCSDGGEACTNGLDDDSDGRIDCADTDCAHTAACLGLAEACANGIDDDGDGDTDCDDDYCAGSPECTVGVESCINGVDDDGDSLVDCADDDCRSRAPCLGEGACDDGVDNDSDGLTDCDDVEDCGANQVCYAIELNINGTGLVQSRSGDIQCTSTCTLSGTADTLELFATGTGDNNLVDWTICPDESGPLCTVEAEGRVELSVTFGALASYRLPGIAGCFGDDDGLAVLDELRHDDLGPDEEATNRVGADTNGEFRTKMGVDESVGHFNVFGNLSFAATHVCVSIRELSAKLSSQGYALYLAEGQSPDTQPRAVPTPQIVAAPSTVGLQMVELVNGFGPTSGTTWIGAIFPESTAREMGTGPGRANASPGEAFIGLYDEQNQGLEFELFDFTDYTAISTSGFGTNRPILRLQRAVPRSTMYGLDIVASGQGTVEVLSLGEQCADQCSYTVPVLKGVLLRGVADAGANLIGWSGCDATYGDYCFLRMTGPRVADVAFQ